MYSLIPFTIAMGQWITQSRLLSAIVGVCAVVFILHAIKTFKDRRDSKRIYDVLRRLTQDEQYTFQSSEAISVVTNLPVSRISVLCSKHPRIERKEQQRHMRRLVN
jgi:putative flippase GtrA